MMKSFVRFFLSCIFSLVIVFSPSFVFADTTTSINSLVTTVDTMYNKIVKSLPRASSSSRLARRLQDKFWNTVQTQLQKKIGTVDVADQLLYKTLLAKVQQRISSFQFPTSDILLQIQLVDATNRVRKENNLPELSYNILLSLSAYSHAKDMYDNFPNKNGEVLSHYGTDGGTVKQRVEKVGYAWSALAENIAWNQTTIDEVMRDWMNSPSHKANILSEKVTELGVAKVGPYRVQNFGKPKKNK